MACACNGGNVLIYCHTEEVRGRGSQRTVVATIHLASEVLAMKWLCIGRAHPANVQLLSNDLGQKAFSLGKDVFHESSQPHGGLCGRDGHSVWTDMRPLGLYWCSSGHATNRGCRLEQNFSAY